MKAQERTNCVTELLLPEAETWLQKEVNLKGPLAGIPVSLKDSVQVKGFDTSVGYARMAGKPCAEDGPMVKLLKDAGMAANLFFSSVAYPDSYRRCSVCQDCTAGDTFII